MATIDERLRYILDKYHSNPREAIWDCHGKWIATHAALEEMARKAGIEFQPPMVLETNSQARTVALCITGRMRNSTDSPAASSYVSEWSIGEAAPINNKNAYPYAMAEKRGKDRVILKLLGLHGLVYSEEESDEFKDSKLAAENAPPKTNGNPSGSGQTPAEPPAPELTEADYTRAKDAYYRIRDALRAATSAPQIEDIWRLQTEALAVIKRAYPDSHQRLEHLADDKLADMNGALTDQ